MKMFHTLEWVCITCFTMKQTVYISKSHILSESLKYIVIELLFIYSPIAFPYTITVTMISTIAQRQCERKL